MPKFDGDHLSQIINDGIRKKIEEILEEETKLVAQKVEKRVREMVGEVATSVAHRMSFERMGNELVIRVEIQDKKS